MSVQLGANTTSLTATDRIHPHEEVPARVHFQPDETEEFSVLDGVGDISDVGIGVKHRVFLCTYNHTVEVSVNNHCAQASELSYELEEKRGGCFA